jgi:hypothetical protein
MTEHIVFKYALTWDDVTEIYLPDGAEVLHVDVQGPDNDLQLWALVSTGAPFGKRRFRIAGTGHPINDAVSHVGTVLLHDSALVFHVFEVTA